MTDTQERAKVKIYADEVFFIQHSDTGEIWTAHRPDPDAGGCAPIARVSDAMIEQAYLKLMERRLNP